MKTGIEKEAKALLQKSMTKKAYCAHVKKERGKLMPRPVVFEDKRHKEKYRKFC